MKFLYRLLALALSLSLFHSAATAAEDPSLSEILQKHLEAMGGLSNWQKVESIQLNGTIERDGQTVDIVIVKKRPNQIRATVTVPMPGKQDVDWQVIRAHDGKTAWTATRLAGAPEMQKETLPSEAANELLADSGVLPPLIKLWRSGAKLTLNGLENIGGENYYQIQAITEEHTIQYTFYLSIESFLISRYKSTHPINGTTVTILRDYTKNQNVLIPTINIIHANKTGDSIMTISSIKIGVGIYEEYFVVGKSTGTAGL